jgi:ParB/RepB/Spo0J family partition protein
MKKSKVAEMISAQVAPSPSTVGWSRMDAEPRPDDTKVNTSFVDLSPKLVLDDPDLRNERQFVPDAEMEEMVSSVRERGILQPIGVRMKGSAENPTFVRVYGYKRHQAALRLGLEKITVRNHGMISEQDAAVLQWAENDDRSAPHWADKALRAAEMDRWFGKQEAAATALGINTTAFSRMVRMGRAVALLEPSELTALYSAEVGAEERRELLDLEPSAIAAHLRDKIGGRPPAASKRQATTPAAVNTRTQSGEDLFKVRPYQRGGGEAASLRYRATDLRNNPRRALELALFCIERVEVLRETLEHATSRALPRELREEADAVKGALGTLDALLAQAREALK